jgi:hypothetical protein
VVISTVWNLKSVAYASRNLALTRTLTKKKYTYKHNSSSFDSKIEHVSPHLKGLGAKIVMSSSPALVAYSLIRPKPHISNIGHYGTLLFRNFMMKEENFKRISIFI